MSAYLTDAPHPGAAFPTSPVLIVADGDAAARRAHATLRACGLRSAGAVGLDDAVARIDRQVAVSAVWVELEQDRGETLDDLLLRLNGDSRAGRYQGVLSAPLAMLDILAARVGDSGIDLIIDGTDADRVAALATACSGMHSEHRLSDVATDRSADRLRQLSEEVNRIAAALARLSTGPQPASRATELPAVGDVPEVSAETVRAVIRARRLRSRYFPDDLFADPAWDMLLDLLQAEIAQLRVPVSSLCIAAAVPATTALRWLKTMTQQGLFLRRADPHDGRRVFVELAPKASLALRRYFSDIGQPAVV